MRDDFPHAYAEGVAARKARVGTSAPTAHNPKHAALQRVHISLLVRSALRQKLRRHPVRRAHRVHAAALLRLFQGRQAEVTHLQRKRAKVMCSCSKSAGKLPAGDLEPQIVVDEQVQAF